MKPNPEANVELPDRLAEAVRVIVAAPIDPAAIERVQQRARQYAAGETRPAPSPRFTRQRRRAIWAAAGLACSALAVSFVIVFLKGDAWAQVARSVESK